MKTDPVDPKLLTARIVDVGTPDHSVMYSAAEGKDGKIYLGLSAEGDAPGVNARMIAYDPKADAFEEVFDLAKLIPEASDRQRHPHSKLHTATCVGKDGTIYAATHMTAPPADEDFYHYWHAYNDPARCFKGSHLIIYDPKTKEARDFGIVAPKGGCRWMTYNPELEELYITSFLASHFIVIRLRTGEVKDLGRISYYDFMGPCYSECGYVFTTNSRGHMLRYDPKRETIETLPVKIPNEPWRSSDANGVFHLLPGPDGVKLYGAGPIGRRLFEYDPTQGEHGLMRDLGAAWGKDRMDDYSETPMIRTMTVAPDGRVYLAVKYTQDSQAEHGAKATPLDFRYNLVGVDPETGEKTDYGLLQAQGLPPTLGCVAMTAAQDGTIYVANYRVRRHLPVQLQMFHPDGVKQGPPPAWEEPTEDDSARWAKSSKRLGYHRPTREDNAWFVSQGTVFARELGEAGRIPFIPRNECAITALAVAPTGVLYGATSGERSHFFCMTPLSKRILPVNTFGAAGGCRCLAVDAKGRVFAGTMPKADGEGGRLHMFDAPEKELWLRTFDDSDRGEFSGLPRPPSEGFKRMEDLGECVPGEGIYSMALDKDNGLVHGLSWPGGKFFTHDIEAGETAVHDIFDEHIAKRSNISRAMLCRRGAVYFSGRHGYIIRHTPFDNRFENTGLKIPVAAGREYLNTATALVETPEGIVYGGTYADGFLFRADLDRGEMVNLGRPSSESRIDGLTLGRDGKVWGVCGGAEELTHLFRHDPRTGDMKDCGVIRSKLPMTWIMHKSEAIATGLDGEVYIGETDAVSHLFMYFPPIDAPPVASYEL